MKLFIYCFLSVFTINVYAQVTVDDYPVTNEMFNKSMVSDGIQIGEAYSFENMWFTNSELKQTLLINLATDYHRYIICHFLNRNIPPEILHSIPLYKKTGNSQFDVLEDSLKKKYIPNFVNHAKEINAEYFTLKKGLQLSSTEDKAISIYGKPDSVLFSDGFKILSWYYDTDPQFSGVKNSKKFAVNSFGYRVKMYFINDKLIAMLMVNEIP